MSDQQNNSDDWVDVKREDNTGSVNGSADVLVAQTAATTGGQDTIPEDYKKELEKDNEEPMEKVEEKIVASHVAPVGGNTIPKSYEKELEEGDEKFKERKRKELKKAVDDIIFRPGKEQTIEKSTDSAKTASENENVEPLIQASTAPTTGGTTTIPGDYKKELETTSTEENKVEEKMVEVIEAGSQVTGGNTIPTDYRKELEESTITTDSIREESIDTQSTVKDSEKVTEEKIEPSQAVTTGDSTIPKQYQDELNKPPSADEESEINEAGEPEIIPIQSPVIGKTTIPSRYKEELNQPGTEEETKPKERLTPSKVEVAGSADKGPVVEKPIVYRRTSGMSVLSVVSLFLIAGIIVATLVSKQLDDLKEEHLKEIAKWNEEHATLVTKMSGMDILTKEAFKDVQDKIRQEQQDIQKDLKEKQHMFDQQVLRIKDGMKHKEEKIEVSLEELEDEMSEQNQINKDKVGKEELNLKTWFENEKSKLMDDFRSVDTEQGKQKKKGKESSKQDSAHMEKKLKELRELKEENLKLQYKLRLTQATSCYKCPGKIDDNQHLYKIQEVELQQLEKEHEKEMTMRTMNHDGQNFVKKKCKEEFGKLLKFVIDKEETLKKL